MRIDSSGNVGIGTNSIGSKFHVIGLGQFNVDANGTSTPLKLVNNATTGTVVAKLAFENLGTVKASINAAVYNADFLTFNTASDTERMRIDGSGNVGIGTSSPTQKLDVRGSGVVSIKAESSDNSAQIILNSVSGGISYINYAQNGANSLAFYDSTAIAERMRINSAGDLLVGTTTTSPGSGNTTVGIELGADGQMFASSASAPAFFNRNVDGTIVSFSSAGTAEGTISISGTTTSYNGGHLARWSQLPDGSKDETILKGTVLSNLDEMCVWEKDGVVAANEQLNKMKVSDVEGDTNVAGVFVNWTMDEQYGVDDMNVAMTGDMIIRIADGVVVQKGDLLVSAGDGTAKPQGDDIVRSKTVAKVTSNYVTCTYADGSYCVPCVLMAC
jgi:hypothetical protein